jgi:broad specificity phosphatase PhoE
MLRSPVLVATLLLLAACAFAEPATHTEVYIVRHGEKAGEPKRDPGLTAAGEARAAALAERFAGADLTGIVTSQFLRTRATAAPTAQATGLAPVVVRYRPGDFEVHGREVARTIRKRFSGGVVLVVGHSDTVPWIVQALGGPEMEPLCEATEYASVFELTLEEGLPTRFARSAYGKPDPPKPDDCRIPRAG